MILHFNDGGGPGQACAEGYHDDGVAFFDFSRLHGLVEGDGDRGRRGVAGLIDIDEDFFAGETQMAARGVDDALVDLMRDNHGYIVDGKVALLHGVFDERLHFGNGEFVDFASLHFDVVVAVFEGGGGGWFFGAAAGDKEQRPTFAVGGEFGILDPAIGFVNGREHYRTGSISEEDATAAIFVIGEPRDGFGADDKDIFIDTRFDELGCGGQGIDESATGGGKIESAAIFDT